MNAGSDRRPSSTAATVDRAATAGAAAARRWRRQQQHRHGPSPQVACLHELSQYVPLLGRVPRRLYQPVQLAVELANLGGGGTDGGGEGES